MAQWQRMANSPRYVQEQIFLIISFGGYTPNDQKSYTGPHALSFPSPYGATLGNKPSALGFLGDSWSQTVGNLYHNMANGAARLFTSTFCVSMKTNSKPRHNTVHD